MDKDVQMISLLLNTLKDLFKTLRILSGEVELKKIIAEIQDAIKPYSLKLAEPGIITGGPDLAKMKTIRKYINDGETVSEILSFAKEMLAFVRAKNEKLSLAEFEVPEFAEFIDPEYASDMPPSIGSDNSDAGNSPGGTRGGDTPIQEEPETDSKEESSHDDNDGPPGNDGGSSSSDN